MFCAIFNFQTRSKKLDQKINRQMQENFSYYGKKIEKVNPQMQDTSKSNGETKP